MTKHDLVKVISDETGIARQETSIVVDKLLDSIKDYIMDGRTIEIRGFGTFKLKVRKPRMGRNPKTGDDVQIPERVVPTFKYSHSLKEDIRDLPPEEFE